MLLAVFPTAFKPTLVCFDEHQSTCIDHFVVLKKSFQFSLFSCVGNYTFAMKFTIFHLTHVCPSVGLLKFTMSLPFVIFKLASIDISILVFVNTCPVKLSIFERTFINASGDGQTSLAVIHIVLPQTFVSVSIQPHSRSPTMSLAVQELSFVMTTINKGVFPTALLHVILPGAFVRTACAVGERPDSMVSVVHPITFVSTLVSICLLTLSMPSVV
mmetsp:Transcript_6960/g.11777  ORF Transcript_6960/g.11777 Transcript_6960/m.11777 type:complete len:215 (+) Transcript_6960:713-1357(+)